MRDHDIWFQASTQIDGNQVAFLLDSLDHHIAGKSSYRARDQLFQQGRQELLWQDQQVVDEIKRGLRRE